MLYNTYHDVEVKSRKGEESLIKLKPTKALSCSPKFTSWTSGDTKIKKIEKVSSKNKHRNKKNKKLN